MAELAGSYLARKTEREGRFPHDVMLIERKIKAISMCVQRLHSLRQQLHKMPVQYICVL